MKDFRVFVEHAELAAEWSKTLEEMQEKVGKKKPAKNADSRKPKKVHARIKPDVLTHDAEGLRVKDSAGEEYTITMVEPPQVELEDPTGSPITTTVAGMSKYKLD